LFAKIDRKKCHFGRLKALSISDEEESLIRLRLGELDEPGRLDAIELWVAYAVDVSLKLPDGLLNRAAE